MVCTAMCRAEAAVPASGLRRRRPPTVPPTGILLPTSESTLLPPLSMPALNCGARSLRSSSPEHGGREHGGKNAGSTDVPCAILNARPRSGTTMSIPPRSGTPLGAARKAFAASTSARQEWSAVMIAAGSSGCALRAFASASTAIAAASSRPATVRKISRSCTAGCTAAALLPLPCAAAAAAAEQCAYAHSGSHVGPAGATLWMRVRASCRTRAASATDIHAPQARRLAAKRGAPYGKFLAGVAFEAETVLQAATTVGRLREPAHCGRPNADCGGPRVSRAPQSSPARRPPT